MSLILYVEDHPPARFLMEAIIRDLTPYRLVTAASCAEARRRAASDLPDVYIIDLDLPDGDGYSLAKDLRALHEAPTIITSAFDQTGALRQTGFEFIYLRKPLDPDDVARTLQRVTSRPG
ncbi:MAG: response regulator [Anaerolineae bacterium]|nr:response regulator [Anaerolineae bacterium]NUQ02676.1 response regulator [Anaerolineae bacterium]